ncbi:MAG: 4-(cytidine 5'-diphospho)-2-C-methyl-D-erythritol kinase [Proteobacteria bacterium]|nr:4-(cytidine 5'-diphospho)-2-C-methyl-D-erythritol kinase [Pseudomonadota bacterium]MBU1739238.1 4-(cytidine 5'-diphospho)-2-C-methyl-D-erythritol kinase [Pseudomonadota bacterium]
MSVKNLVIKAPAKINLYLSVLSRRNDGYHEIDSLMQKIDLFDILTITPGGKGIKVVCPGAELPVDKGNLVWQAAQLFCDEIGADCGVQIILQKNIPIAAGLGGGSSDAAAVIKALNSLYGAGMNPVRMSELAVQLGADVPFFIYEGPAAFARGIGERLEAACGLGECWVLLVNPGFAVSTKWVYDNLALTSKENPNILASGKDCPSHLISASGGAFSRLPEPCFYNDLETVTLAGFPEVNELKERMLAGGAEISLMTGSGPTVFGVFSKEEKALDSYRSFAEQYGAVYLTRPM